MTTPTTAPAANTNKLGLDVKAYAGSPSTLCTGCGHDTIANHIIQACYQSDIPPNRLLKMSGIGCSSKLPTYFINGAFGFNSMHGRMAPVATGARVVRPDLFMIGISGDGDTANIGMGGFIHMMRRNVPMTYIVANNGVFGLTKGQFSATADMNSKNKMGDFNPFQSVDLCNLALDAGCSFVARSFSGDAKQLVPLIKAAFSHRGTAFIDVISPCITFNNHDGSTKSYTYLKEHDISLQELGYIAPQQESTVDYAEGERTNIELVDGSLLTLKKLDSRAHDVTDRSAAAQVMRSTQNTGEILTGLFYVNEKQESLIDKLHLTKTPLADLQEKDLRSSQDDLNKIMAGFK